MDLPLLFGFITYFSIIFGLTFWLTKYHLRTYYNSEQKTIQADPAELLDESNCNLQNVPPILPSGDTSLPNDKQGRG